MNIIFSVKAQKEYHAKRDTAPIEQYFTTSTQSSHKDKVSTHTSQWYITKTTMRSTITIKVTKKTTTVYSPHTKYMTTTIYSPRTKYDMLTTPAWPNIIITKKNNLLSTTTSTTTTTLPPSKTWNDYL